MDSSLEFSGSLGSVSSLLSRCRTFKVLVIGDSGVGKTSLTHRLCGGEFPGRAEATIGVDFRERQLEVDGERIKLQLWDTAGQERFRKSMVQHYYRNVHAVLLVYDVSCPASFLGLSAWLEELRQNALGLDIPRFLVGNKSDLCEAASGPVSPEKALSFATTHGMMFFQTSAKRPPRRRGGGGGGGGAPFQQSEVEEVIAAVGAKLKRQKKALGASPPASSGSFKVCSKKTADKDVWVCC